MKKAAKEEKEKVISIKLNSTLDPGEIRVFQRLSVII